MEGAADAGFAAGSGLHLLPAGGAGAGLVGGVVFAGDGFGAGPELELVTPNRPPVMWLGIALLLTVIPGAVALVAAWTMRFYPLDAGTLARVQALFNDKATHCFTVDEVVSETGLSKTTTRRYLEHCVEAGFLSVEMLYGKIGHPRRMYKRSAV